MPGRRLCCSPSTRGRPLAARKLDPEPKTRETSLAVAASRAPRTPSNGAPRASSGNRQLQLRATGQRRRASRRSSRRPLAAQLREARSDRIDDHARRVELGGSHRRRGRRARRGWDPAARARRAERHREATEMLRAGCAARRADHRNGARAPHRGARQRLPRERGALPRPAPEPRRRPGSRRGAARPGACGPRRTRRGSPAHRRGSSGSTTRSTCCSRSSPPGAWRP